jgi:polysaccharide export outer membrane protein
VFPLAALLPFSSLVAYAQVAGGGQAVSADAVHHYPIPLTAALGQTSYKLGAGDEIVLSVVGRPELSGPQTVGPDGQISVASVGSISVAGLTREQAAKAVRDALSVDYESPSVSVQVTKYSSQRIVLLGNIEHPGELEFDQPPTLLQVLARGGSSSSTSSSTSKNTLPPLRCTIYRQNGDVLDVNLQDADKNLLALGTMILERNDVVFIPLQHAKTVSVLGEVKSPGPVTLTPESTLLTVLSESGGMTDAASKQKIEVLHKGSTQPQLVSFASLMKSGGTDAGLKDGDIIYVPKSGFSQMGYVLQQLSPIFSLGTVVSIVAR